MTPSAVSATSGINVGFGRAHFAVFLSLALAGCSAHFYVRENLAEGQILDPVVVRKPSDEKNMGIFPKYVDYLEGYITGGIIEPEGRPLQGAQVKVTDESGADLPNFEGGVTHKSGMFKAHFSLPVRWNRVDFTGAIVVDKPWQVTAPKPQFKISYNGRVGVLAYFAKPMWVPVKTTSPIQKAPPPAPRPKKSSDDIFGGSDFGQ